MRSIFGVLSLLLALGIVGVVVKKQLAATQASSMQPGQPEQARQAAPAASPQQTQQQTQQQFKQALDAAMQSAQPAKDRAVDEK